MRYRLAEDYLEFHQLSNLCHLRIYYFAVDQSELILPEIFPPLR